MRLIFFSFFSHNFLYMVNNIYKTIGENFMNELERIKKMYDNGFRCIRYDDTKDGDMCIYFKNFDNEDSDALRVSDFEQKMQIKNFINENTMR